MGQGNDVESVTREANTLFGANDLIEPRRVNELRDRELAHRNDQFGPENLNFPM